VDFHIQIIGTVLPQPTRKIPAIGMVQMLSYPVSQIPCLPQIKKALILVIKEIYPLLLGNAVDVKVCDSERFYLRCRQ
jgi:hypothetical protein